jgi:hypothetical protein
LVNGLQKEGMEVTMALVTELRRRRRYLRQEGGLAWTAVAILLSASVALLTGQLAGWL